MLASAGCRLANKHVTVKVPILNATYVTRVGKSLLDVVEAALLILAVIERICTAFPGNRRVR